MTTFDEVQAAVHAASGEAGEKHAVVQVAGGLPEVIQGRLEDRRTVRTYVWRRGPLGAVALVTGPDVEATLYKLHEHAPGDPLGAVYFPAKGRNPALSSGPRRNEGQLGLFGRKKPRKLTGAGSCPRPPKAEQDGTQRRPLPACDPRLPGVGSEDADPLRSFAPLWNRLWESERQRGNPSALYAEQERPPRKVVVVSDDLRYRRIDDRRIEVIRKVGSWCPQGVLKPGDYDWPVALAAVRSLNLNTVPEAAKAAIWAWVPDLRWYDVIIFNSSSGKDSQAMMLVGNDLATQAGVRERIWVIHCDLGEAEHTGTEALVHEHARDLDLPQVAVVKRAVRGEYVSLLQRFRQRAESQAAKGKTGHGFPGHGTRYCTSEFKTGEVIKWFNAWVDRTVGKGDLVKRCGRRVRCLNVLGLRAEESDSRAGTPFKVKEGTQTRAIVEEWLPIQGWLTGRFPGGAFDPRRPTVWDRIASSATEPHPAYGAGFSRLSCTVCPLAGVEDVALGALVYPEFAQGIMDIENDTGATFREKGTTLTEIVEQASPEIRALAAKARKLLHGFVPRRSNPDHGLCPLCFGAAFAKSPPLRTNPYAVTGKVRTDTEGEKYVEWRPVLADGSRPRIRLPVKDASVTTTQKAEGAIASARGEVAKGTRKLVAKKKRSVRVTIGHEPRVEPLFDATGREYAVTYRVVATATTGSGPVVPSNDPKTMRPEKGYPVAFQARSLEGAAEVAKIEEIARNLQPTRLLVTNADPTIGPPVVWGQGKKLYVLGGNGRTIALLKAPAERYNAYVDEGRERWPKDWPTRKAPKGKRYLLVREVRWPDGSALTEQEAVVLAGASQEATSAAESPIGKALSTVRGLGISSVSELPTFTWGGIVDGDNVADFQARNPTFVSSLISRLDRAQGKRVAGDSALLSDLVNAVMVGFLPPEVQRQGFASEKDERALLAAMPILATLHQGVQRGKIKAKWDLLPRLDAARQFAVMVRNKSVEQAITMVERADQQVQLGEGTKHAVSTLFDDLDPLAIAFAILLKRAGKGLDPANTIRKDLGEGYKRPAMEPGERDETPRYLQAARDESDNRNQMTMGGGMFGATEAKPAFVLASLQGIRLPTRLRKNPASAERWGHDYEVITLPRINPVGDEDALGDLQLALFSPRVLTDLVVQHFASGSNHAGEIRGFVALRKPVGVAAATLAFPGRKNKEPTQDYLARGRTPRWSTLCDKKCEDALVEGAAAGVPVFIDSGAFSEVEFGPEGPLTVLPIDDSEWRRRLDLYERVLDRSGAGRLVNVVAPDKVGFQGTTLERLRRYAPRVQRLASKGATILVPLQKGDLTLPAFHDAVTDALGFTGWVPAIPMKKAATTPQELEGYLRAKRPARVHLLGVGPRSRIAPEVVAAALDASPSTEVQMDSVLLRAAVGRGKGPGGTDKPLTVAQDVARAEALAHRWGGYPAMWRDAQGGRLPDYTDHVGVPSAWMSKPALKRVGKAAGLTGTALKAWRADPDEALQQDIGGVSLYEVPEVSEAIDLEWGKLMHALETAQVKQHAVERHFATEGAGPTSKLSRANPASTIACDDAPTLYLVACAKQKQDQPAAAADLYTSDSFRKARAYVERQLRPGDHWGILSAAHGLVAPSQTLAPYDVTLAGAKVAQRRSWAQETAPMVADALLAMEAATGVRPRVVFLAGQSYREFLVPTLEGYDVEVPMEGLGIGQQKRWLLDNPSGYVSTLPDDATHYLASLGARPGGYAAPYPQGVRYLVEHGLAQADECVDAADTIFDRDACTFRLTKLGKRRLQNMRVADEAESRARQGALWNPVDYAPVVRRENKAPDRQGSFFSMMAAPEPKVPDSLKVPDEPLRDEYDSLFEEFGPHAAPAPGRKGYKPEPKADHPDAWDPYEAASGMIDAAVRNLGEWEFSQAYMWETGETGDQYVEESWWEDPENAPDWTLNELIGPPRRDGKGRLLSEDQRFAMTMQAIDWAMEADPFLWQGDQEALLDEGKSRSGDAQPRYAQRRGGAEIPLWATKAAWGDELARATPGYDMKLRLVNVSKPEAAAFIEKHHSQLPYLNPRGLMYALGLKRGNRLVAVATAGHPTGKWSRRDPHHVVELTRVASDGSAKGAASKLVSRLLDLLPRSGRGKSPSDPKVFVTYQLASEDGTSYKALKDKGLRPVEYRPGSRKSGARKDASDDALAHVPKIRWECCDEPPADRAKWSLIEPTRQGALIANPARIHVSRGLLVTYYEPYDLDGAFIRVRSQVYDPNGRPATLDYEGPGQIIDYEPYDPDAKKRRLVLGDPYAEKNLIEYVVDSQPTDASNEYDAGYRKGFTERRRSADRTISKWSPERLDGWQQGRADRRRDNPEQLELGLFGRILLPPEEIEPRPRRTDGAPWTLPDTSINPRSIELFAGGGLFALAQRVEGVIAQHHCEWDEAAVATIRANLDDHASACDVRTYEPQDVPGGVDILTGGPPCQPWSQGGSRKGVDDERNLWPRVLDLIDRLHPRIVLMENVSGILYKEHEDFVKGWLERIYALGYEAAIWEILAADYGSGQLRPRVWFVAWPAGAPWGDALGEPPPPKYADPRKAAKLGLIPWVRGFDRSTDGCCGGYGYSSCINLMDLDGSCRGCFDGSNYAEAPNDTNEDELSPGQIKFYKTQDALYQHPPLDTGGAFVSHTIYGRGQGKRTAYVAPTIMKGPSKGKDYPMFGTKPGAHIDFQSLKGSSCPVDPLLAALRPLSVREIAKLQSVPQWYEFKGTEREQQMQVGNGIDVNMGRAVIQHVMKALGYPSPFPGSMASRGYGQGLWPMDRHNACLEYRQGDDGWLAHDAIPSAAESGIADMTRRAQEVWDSIGVNEPSRAGALLGDEIEIEDFHDQGFVVIKLILDRRHFPAPKDAQRWGRDFGYGAEPFKVTDTHIELEQADAPHAPGGVELVELADGVRAMVAPRS